jgi:hypothetical protein
LILRRLCEGPIRRPERGSEWELIEILSYEMNSTYTLIFTQITYTHKSGSKLGTHKPTSPRDMPRIKKRKPKTRG